ncbi:MAG: hypothetical protein LBQ81_04810 [Zoogloeaceae bacterium]|jgi:hypothetical protein|nr:hypothetical protein [Zoogloeaceae bacterium]
MTVGWIQRVIAWCTTYKKPNQDSKSLTDRKKKIFLIVGLVSLFNATIDVLREKWEPSLAKWQWFSDLLIACFGQYGFVGFEFTIAVIFFLCWLSAEK